MFSRYLPALLIIGLLSFGLRARAQEVPLKFGKLEAREADALLASAPRDSAAAEVLCDFGQSKIKGKQDGFELYFERTARLLIRRPEGYDHATVRVPLYHDAKTGQAEKIAQLKGFTYHLDGTQLSREPLRTEAVFSRKVDSHYDEYAFTLPNVRAGSIIEFTYLVTSPFLFNLQPWQFQQDIPVRWSEYRVAIPSFYRYKELTRTYWPFAVNETGTEPYSTTYQQSTDTGYGTSTYNSKGLSISTQALTRRWVLRDVPAFRAEPFMTTPRDYLSRLDFELERIQFEQDRPPQFQAGSWEQIEKQLRSNEDFGGYLTRDSPLKAAAEALRTLPEPAERAAAVRQLVLGAVVYDGAASLFTRAVPRRVVEQRQGNAAEINLLLVALLRQAGLDAQPLLLSTRNHGQVQTELPVVTQFNYVVAHVALAGEKTLLLDATDGSLPANLLPENCLSGQGRLLGPAGRWVALATGTPHFLYTQAQLSIAPDGSLRGDIRQEYAGYAAAEFRRPLPELRKHWQQTHPDWEIDKAELLSRKEEAPGSLVALGLQAHLAGAPAPAGTLYLRPLQHLMPLSNPFRHAERLYPVDLATPPRTECTLELILPAGYTATELPASIQLALPDNGGRFLFHATSPTPGKLTLVVRLQLTKTHYSATEYQALRELYTQALAKLAEPLVIQRQ